MDDCIFCKIIRGELPSHKLYEDDQVIVILDHRPVRPGHAMVIPKQHIDYFMNLSDDLASHIVKIGNILARKMMDTLEPKPLTIGHLVHGYVPHVHYHLVPQHDWDDITSSQCVRIENNELVFDAEMIPVADDEAQRKLVQNLKIERPE
jgi:histidine triad (HIT) family protein